MKRKTTSEFITQAQTVHKGTYTYPNCHYRTRDDHVTINCSLHGAFRQNPVRHLNGSGCPKCATLRQTLTKEQFIVQAKTSHGDCNYGYSKVVYVNSRTKVTITCRVHGDFKQRPSDHMRGDGCPYCSERVKKDTSSFINKAKGIHGDKYEYHNSEYVNSNTKVRVTCRLHGDFLVKPYHHYKGSGCPSCANYGFDLNAQAFLYLLKGDNGKYKVGITKKPARRFAELRNATPFLFEPLHVFGPLVGDVAMCAEKVLTQHLNSAGFSGFSGCTEWFDIPSESEWVTLCASLIGSPA